VRRILYGRNIGFLYRIEAPHRDKIQDWLKLDEGDTAFLLQTEEEIAKNNNVSGE
jgi:arsenate reductase-like glutaredoxin family protein